MAKVIVAAKVEDLAAWEEGFRSHGDLFRRQTISKPVNIGTNNENEVALIFEPEDLGVFMEVPDNEGPEALANDGFNPETVKFFVVDKEFQL
jgi:hypothetical protein